MTGQVTPTGYLFQRISRPKGVPALVRVRSACIALIALAFTSPAFAEPGKLSERLTPEVMAVVYPGAERLGKVGVLFPVVQCPVHRDFDQGR